jgi:hypothetical protein
MATRCAYLTPVFEAPDEIAHVDYVNFAVGHAASLLPDRPHELSTRTCAETV